MATRRGEDSKQGLVIALVVFVLLSIGLGVATYYGFAEQQNLKNLAAKEKKQADANKASRDWEQYQNLLLKAYIGHPLVKEDQEALTDLVARNENGQLGKDEKNKADFDKLSADLKAKLGWDDGKRLPRSTYLALTESQDNQVKQLTATVAKLEEDNKKALAETNARAKDSEARADGLTKELEKAKTAYAALKAEKSDAFNKAVAENQKLQEQVEEARKQLDRAKEEFANTQKKLNKEIKDQGIQIGRLQDEIKPPNVLDYDKPKGRITHIERGASVVYIDLGTRDNVNPQLTFSIYGVGPGGKALPQRKGALEVTKVLGPHSSQARITELTDPNRDPVLRGDLLFNPIWSPTLRKHVAIAGAIDLTGEGTNEMAEFMRGLARQGIVVDAYLDLQDPALKVKGEGMNPKTTYLVLGDQPEFREDADVNVGDIRVKNKTDILNKIAEMKKQAEKMGITVIPYRRFLEVIGYPMPRQLTTRTGSFFEVPPIGADMKAREAAKEKETEKKAEKPEGEKKGADDKEKEK